jgi:hypothetical protein
VQLARRLNDSAMSLFYEALRVLAHSFGSPSTVKAEPISGGHPAMMWVSCSSPSLGCFFPLPLLQIAQSLFHYRCKQMTPTTMI